MKNKKQLIDFYSVEEKRSSLNHRAFDKKINKSCAWVVLMGFILMETLWIAPKEIFGEDKTASQDTKQDAKQDSKDLPPDILHQDEVHMLKGELTPIKAYSLVRVSVSDPDIADIANVTNDEILLLAKKPGQSALFVWDQYGKRTIMIRVYAEDLNILKTRLEELFKVAKIDGVNLEVNLYEGKVVASGNLSEQKKAEADAIIHPYMTNVINLLREDISNDLVQVDVQLAELNATASKSIGLDWVDQINITEGLPGKGLVDSTAQSSIPFADSIFKVAKLRRTTSVSAVINAVVEEGKGRVLSKPKLVVKSGKEASFLVGGQVPISTTSTTVGGNVQTNVEFKDFGISLTITPTIQQDKVNVVMNTEVSEVDPTHSVGQVPAFATRTAQTQLLLDDQQTIILAGLIKHVEGETVRKVPFLGDIPIVGAVFRSRKTPSSNNQDTELIISVTPTILRQKTKEVPPPAAKTTESSTSDAASVSSSDSSMTSETSVPPSRMPTQSSMSENADAIPLQDATAEATDQSSGEQAGASGNNAEQKDLIDAYSKTIQEKISKAITYPPEAKEKGWEGTVTLSLHLLKNGSLADSQIKESSGYNIFDKDALHTAQVLSPYDAFPLKLNLDDLVLNVPIVYSQKVSKPAAAKSSSSQNYAAAVQQKIASAINYPDEARQYNWEGTVKLMLHILSDGTLAYAAVKESSGHDIFDEAALTTAKSLAPYTAFPADTNLQELDLTIPIVFSLQK